MAKRPRSLFVCSSCGHTESKWLGRCPQCGEWNTLQERATAGAETRASRATASGAGRASAATRGPDGAGPLELAAIERGERARVSTGTGELDRVLGGGIVHGSTVLIGGEPGIGKSTLMLQMAARMQRQRVLYVSGEESAEQLKMRAERLELADAGLSVLAESSLEAIADAIASGEFEIVIVDSIQTIYSPEAGAVPGTPNQIKLTTFEISELARARGISVFFVAHVTKEGNIAGPRTIEHMVDTVLYFEQNSDDTRFLRATKNRFGSTDEVGLFTMQARGLLPIADPNSIFLVQRSSSLPPGVVVAPVIEGTRVLLVEIQALTVPAKGGVSRVFSDGLESRRVSRMAAVLEKHVGLNVSDQDIYVNVAGGMRIREVGVELALAMALYSARTDAPFPDAASITGELSLAGEVRPVPQMARRARTARELGFPTCIGPATVRSSEEPVASEWTGVSTVRDAISRCFGASG